MSMTRCAICDDIYDTDYQMNVNEVGDCVCDKCWEEYATECDCCGNEEICSKTIYMGMDVNTCYNCSKPNKL